MTTTIVPHSELGFLVHQARYLTGLVIDQAGPTGEGETDDALVGVRARLSIALHNLVLAERAADRADLDALELDTGEIDQWHTHHALPHGGTHFTPVDELLEDHDTPWSPAHVATVLDQWIAQTGFLRPGRFQILRGDTTRDQYPISVRIYTAEHYYTITARGTQTVEDSYLGCIASRRAPRPGEEHQRGNDLPDGPLCVATWVKILAAIVGYEALEVHDPPDPAGPERAGGDPQ